MKKARYTSFLKGLLLVINLAAVLVLTAGLIQASRGAYGRDILEAVIKGKSYLQTEQFQEQSSEAVYSALQMMAESSRMEKDGLYDPDRIIRVRDYLDSRMVYDIIPESEKKDGICYRMGDLYQWSLKGMESVQDVLQESYQPLFYGSIQEYCNECDEPYNAVVSQLGQVMELLRKDVAEYQKAKKNWASELTNVRYLLWDMGSGNICTNVDELQKKDVSQEVLDTYFKGFGSYYIFDSRSTSAAQQNIGDYFSYNTHALLSGWSVHLDGEYQVFVGIDTEFPAADQMAAGKKSYEEAQHMWETLRMPMLISAGILFLTVLFLLWKMAGMMVKCTGMLAEHSGIVLLICICFAAYEIIQMILRLVLGNGATAHLVLAVYKLAVLGLLIWEGVQRRQLLDGVRAMNRGEEDAHISTEHLFPDNRRMAEAVNDLGDGLRDALKEQMKSERMKADLITNVSHDLKTPLTSVINYVDLMKKEQIDNPKVQEYLQVLDQKSQRLKQLTDDLVEASRASSGNVVLDMQKIDFKELLMQTGGEFQEKFTARGLSLISNYPDHPLYVEADGRRLWRVVENLYRNVEKYAMPGTRVYLDVECDGCMVSMSMKNISEQSLNISAEELVERFTRGDESRTTEGSGLGLSIAKDLTELQKGTFEVQIDGDLFKVTVAFPWVPGEELIN